MARKPRVHFPGALYHVISRGNQRQDIFFEDKDLKTFLSYLSEYKTRYPFYLYAYSLMKNHFHLLLEVHGTPLSKIMQSLLFRYTRYFNKRYGKMGHLFQGRYKAILCDKDAYLLRLADPKIAFPFPGQKFGKVSNIFLYSSSFFCNGYIIIVFSS